MPRAPGTIDGFACMTYGMEMTSIRTLPCKECGGTFPETAFYINRATKSGRDYRCRPCALAKLNAYRATRRTRYREWRIEYRAKKPELHKEMDDRARAKLKAKNPNYIMDAVKRRRTADPVRVWAQAVTGQAKIRTKRQGLPISDIDSDYVISLAVEVCPVFGTKLSYGLRGIRKFTLIAPASTGSYPARVM